MARRTAEEIKKEAEAILELAKAGEKEKEILQATIDLKKAELNLAKEAILKRNEYLKSFPELQNILFKSEKDRIKNLKDEIEELEKRNKETKKTIDVYKELEKQVTRVIKFQISLNKSFDSQRAAIAATTGGLGDYSQSLLDAVRMGEDFAITLDEISKGYNAFAGGVVGLMDLSKGFVASMAVQTSALEKLGISSSDSVGMFNIFTKSLGFTGEQARSLQRDIFAAADALGPRMKKMAFTEFAPAMNVLAAHSREKATRELKTLMAQAEATGASLTSLLGVASRFDTFDDAAKAVGELNSLLGGDYYNAIELLKASETERIEIIKERIKLSGRDFSSLSRYEKRAISTTLGFKSLNEALQVFGTEQEKIAQYEKQASEAGITTEEFAKRVKMSADFTQKWNVLLQRLSVILLPVLKALNSGLETIIGWTKGMTTSGKVITGFITVLATLAFTLGTVRLAIKGVMLAFGVAGSGGPATLGAAIIGAFGTGSAVFMALAGLAGGIAVLRMSTKGLADDFSLVADAGAKFAKGITSLAGVGLGNLNQIRKFFNTFKEIKADNVNAISGALKEFQNTIVKVETTRREDIKRTFDLNINIEEPDQMKQDIEELFDIVTLNARRMGRLSNAGP